MRNYQYSYIEERKLFSDDLRNLCIENRWYTRGNNADYMYLLNHVDSIENVTTDDIVEIATDIISHSDINLDDERFEHICWEILEICHSFIAKA